MTARTRTSVFALAAVVAALLPGAADAQTLKSVRDRGAVVCGVSQGLLGFSSADTAGAWTGFDVDYCRALAAAIFDDPAKVRFVPLSAAERFAALKDKRIDVLSRNSTWTLGRETEFGFLFAGISYHDGQGFLVRKARNATSALELDGVKMCAQAGTTSEVNVADYFAQNGMKMTLATFPVAADTLKAYEDGRCDAFTSDVSALFAERLKLARPGDHAILPDVISKEPLGPVVRADDMQWFNIARWTNYAMINAEELGVSSKTLAEALKSQKPDVKRLVGTDGALGEGLGLTKDWAARIVRHVGNYAEVYDRNLGAGSKLGIPRGLNQLWSAGGILYAPPLR